MPESSSLPSHLFLSATTPAFTPPLPSTVFAFSHGELNPPRLAASVKEPAVCLDDPSELEPTGSVRMLSATLGALITSFVVTPFDVVKTRLQAQLHPLHPANQSEQTAAAAELNARPPQPQPPASAHSHSHSHAPQQPLSHGFSPAAAASNSVDGLQGEQGRLQSSRPDVAHPLASSSRVRPLAVSMARRPHLPTSQLLDSCSHTKLQTGLMDTWCQRCVLQPPRPAAFFPFMPQTLLAPAAAGSSAAAFPLPAAQPAAAATESMHFTGTLDALHKLVRHEGVGSLWRGLSPQLLLSIPSTVVYFWAYDELKYSLQAVTSSPSFQSSPLLSPSVPYLCLINPLLAGTSARAITTVLVSPIELIRTRTQSLSTSASMLDIARSEVQKGGIRSLWRGANPTLWRDVPFSAFYWTSYESIKSRMMKRRRRRLEAERRRGGDVEAAAQRSLLWTSFVAGASAGMISAFFTHPFDLVKTRRQIDMYNLAPQQQSAESESAAGAAEAAAEEKVRMKGRTATFDMLRLIVREEGWAGLTTGLFARMTKIVPACAIMISTYEVSKAKFGGIGSHSRDRDGGGSSSGRALKTDRQTM